jgi:hypothetical protein
MGGFPLAPACSASAPVFLTATLPSPFAASCSSLRAEAVPHFLWPSGTRRNQLLHHAIGGCRGTLIAYALRKKEREDVMERDKLLEHGV